MSEFTALPHFAKRLDALLRAYGLNGNSLATRLREIGVSCSPQHAYRILDVPESQTPKLSAELLAGIIHVCPIPANYFFDTDVTEFNQQLTSMYVQRTEPVNRRPGPRAR